MRASERVEKCSTMIDNQHTNTWRRRHTETETKTQCSTLAHQLNKLYCPSFLVVKSNISAYFDFIFLFFYFFFFSILFIYSVFVWMLCMAMHRKRLLCVVHIEVQMCVGRCMCIELKCRISSRTSICNVVYFVVFVPLRSRIIDAYCECIRVSEWVWVYVVHKTCVCCFMMFTIVQAKIFNLLSLSWYLVVERHAVPLLFKISKSVSVHRHWFKSKSDCFEFLILFICIAFGCNAFCYRCKSRILTFMTGISCSLRTIFILYFPVILSTRKYHREEEQQQ